MHLHKGHLHSGPRSVSANASVGAWLTSFFLALSLPFLAFIHNCRTHFVLVLSAKGLSLSGWANSKDILELTLKKYLHLLSPFPNQTPTPSPVCFYTWHAPCEDSHHWNVQLSFGAIVLAGRMWTGRGIKLSHSFCSVCVCVSASSKRKLHSHILHVLLGHRVVYVMELTGRKIGNSSAGVEYCINRNGQVALAIGKCNLCLW